MDSPKEELHWAEIQSLLERVQDGTLNGKVAVTCASRTYWKSNLQGARESCSQEGILPEAFCYKTITGSFYEGLLDTPAKPVGT